jgi:two-component system, sensor histidine kinase and response regulator
MDEFILVVDDNLENLKVVGNILKEQHYKIAIAKSGEEALHLLESMRPVLILLDIMMPKLDGFETCRIIKSKKEWSDIPIIFLTARTEVNDVVTGFSLGAVDYLTKPFNAAELIVRVKNHIDLKRARETMARQADELRKMNLTKDQIFSIISHDMRTPLASLRMLLDTIAHVDICEKRDFVLNCIRLMEVSANESYQLLDNLLYWSRGHLGSLKCTPVLFTIDDQIKKAITLYNYPAQQKKLTILLNCPGETLVYADEDMIQTVLRNVVSNAVKFSFPGTTININVLIRNDETTISISNKGPVMNDSAISIIFSDHDYFTSLGTSGEKGTGLGLKICNTFVTLNSGKLWVESGPDTLTTFFISLPVRKGG